MQVVSLIDASIKWSQWSVVVRVVVSMLAYMSWRRANLKLVFEIRGEFVGVIYLGSGSLAGYAPWKSSYVSEGTCVKTKFEVAGAAMSDWLIKMAVNLDFSESVRAVEARMG